jgi:hypothetical protein
MIIWVLRVALGECRKAGNGSFYKSDESPVL